jgi:hypothetical protein
MTKEKLVRLETQRLPNETFFRFMSENKVYYVKYNTNTPFRHNDMSRRPMRESIFLRRQVVATA